MDFDTLDLSAAAEKPFEFELKHPQTDEGLGVFVSVIGMESETFQAYARQEGNLARRRAFEAQRKGQADTGPVKMEDEEDALLRATAACMTGWRTVIDGESEDVIIWAKRKLVFTPDNALVWLRQFRWARPQVAAAAADIGNFIEG